MLFGGNGGSCGGCGCKSCQECTRGCTEPHTGTAFEPVYTLYFEGAEAGNPDDGYLFATGDVDTSDPYDGMDGTTGPWEQQISGTFTLAPTTTRHPCSVILRFWRSSFVLGPATTPPASAALTAKVVRITNDAASDGPIVIVGSMIPPLDVVGRQIEPGEYLEFDASDITLVPGAGDQSQYDAVSDGFSWIMIQAACGNHSVTFNVSVKIEWNTRARQHILYGLVQECYEEQNDCDACATPGNPNARAYDTIYMTLSNATISVPSSIEGTYVLERVPRWCNYAAFIGPPVEAPRLNGGVLADRPCRSPWTIHLQVSDYLSGTKASPVIEYHTSEWGRAYITSEGSYVDTTNDYDVQCKSQGVIASGTVGMWALECGGSTFRILGTVDWEVFR